jgi:hypothetical protein
MRAVHARQDAATKADSRTRGRAELTRPPRDHLLVIAPILRRGDAVPRIIDLDLIAPQGVTVRKDGEDYNLPGDPPTSVWLGIIHAYDTWVAATDNSDANEALSLFHDRMLALFQLEQPDLTELPFGPAGMFAVLAGFYGADMDEPATDPPGADEAATTKRTTSGLGGSQAKTARKTPTRSRSSRSSAR